MNAPLPLGSFRVVLPDLSWRCDDCGALIPPGEPMVATNGSMRITHEVCPAPWTPEVIDGGRKVASRRLSDGDQTRTSAYPEPVQLALPWLAAVADTRDSEGPS